MIEDENNRKEKEKARGQVLLAVEELLKIPDIIRGVCRGCTTEYEVTERYEIGIQFATGLIAPVVVNRDWTIEEIKTTSPVASRCHMTLNSWRLMVCSCHLS
jgi:hypothetical protein